MNHPEHDIQKSIVELLRWNKILCIQTDVMCALGYVSKKKRFEFIARQKKLGYVTGQSDLVLFLKDGRFVCVELKSEKGQQSLEQKDFQKAIESIGGTYLLWRDSADCEQWIKEYKKV